MYGPTAPARDAAGDALRRDAQDAPLLAVTDLVAGYGRRPVLQGLTFCLRAGECAALLGPNGSGKTTLLRALSGVLAPWSGEVRLADRPLASLRPRERARRVAVVPQRGPCPEDLTAREMVLLGRYAHLSPWGWYGPGDHRAADCALAATDTTGLAHRRLHELSGGELQRVLLARALAQESPLLLLDELAAGLDLARMTGLFDLLERRRAAGACVLMAVHDCNLAALYATRLLGLREGRLAFDGPVRQVFTEENLSALYQTPVTVLPHPLWGLPQALSARARGPWAAPHAAAPAAAASVDTAPAGSAADAPALRSHRPGPGGGRDPHATNVPGNNTRFAKN
ncbi:ABC transporter ATP-binding protein [uncultured Desulfovibrio sp.]|uniref:ABC transporter ATP-binding protein n=1 Tax=uncultured Desulfovibrio sp. TaxID=167968 RepID=UPI0022056DAD|nr:ABC transporter ATP-binding protein [uncultured Desulfovibrio sp.]CAI3231402.1 Vitamin B12 ABC transporter, ATP-binding protein BtuD [Desulfovibrio diazotrophicus]